MSFSSCGRICSNSQDDDFSRQMLSDRSYRRSKNVEPSSCFCSDLLNTLSSTDEDFSGDGESEDYGLFTDREMETIFGLSENTLLCHGFRRLPEELIVLICSLAFSTLQNISRPEAGYTDLSSESIYSLLHRLKVLDEVQYSTQDPVFRENSMILRQTVGRKVQQFATDHLKEVIFMPQAGDMTFYSKIVRSLGGKYVLRTLIFKALKNQDVEKSLDLIALYETSMGGLDFCDRKGRTPLHYASQLSVIDKLIDCGVDADVQDRKGRTALHLSTSSECVNALIGHGADVLLVDFKGNYALHYFKKDGEGDHVDIINSLILAGIDPNVQNILGQTPLHTLANAMDCRFLMSAGAEVHIKDFKDRSPLHSVQNAAKARLLLACDADVNAEDSEGNTPLHLVVDLQIARVFIVNGADIEKKNSSGEIPQIIQDDPDFLEKVLI